MEKAGQGRPEIGPWGGAGTARRAAGGKATAGPGGDRGGHGRGCGAPGAEGGCP